MISSKVLLKSQKFSARVASWALEVMPSYKVLAITGKCGPMPWVV